MEFFEFVKFDKFVKFNECVEYISVLSSELSYNYILPKWFGIMHPSL